ncbi:MAG TPA: hypothetical protein VHG93_26235, partial [Longimicrobium sp.]|nr:hypothetical protein [Longimicrobium sp.]
AAVLAAGAGGEAWAQDDMMMGRRASAFDLGVYGGGAWTTDWFEIGEDGFAPDLEPVRGPRTTAVDPEVESTGATTHHHVVLRPCFAPRPRRQHGCCQRRRSEFSHPFLPDR